MNKPICYSFFCFIFGCMVFIAGGVEARDMELRAGVTGVLDGLETDEVTPESFYDWFTDNGTSAPSFTIDSLNSAVIGAMWSNPAASGKWLDVRIAVDENKDGVVSPIDWKAAVHPWNRPDNGTPDDPRDDPLTWRYVYPEDYPDQSLRGTVITLTWDEDTRSVAGFPQDEFEWAWYESRYDWAMQLSAGESELATAYWFGRDDDWNLLSNGEYALEVRLDENRDGVFSDEEVHKALVIEILTAEIYGKVVDENGNPIQGAKVEAGSFLAWSETTTNADGTFIVSGLQSDAVYTLTVSAAGKLPNIIEDIDVPASETGKNAGEIVLKKAIFISGTIKLDLNANGIAGEDADTFTAFRNQYGWTTETLEITVEAHNTQGVGWGNSTVEIDAGESSKDFSVPIPEGDPALYEIGAHYEGFASTPKIVQVGKNGGDAGDILLSKASLLKGSVKLPKPVTDWTSIDVQAVNPSNDEERYNGWGTIDPFHIPGFCSDEAYNDYWGCEENGGTWTWEQWLDEPMPLDTGAFQFDGVPAGVYNIEIRIMGFKTKILEGVEIIAGQDKDLGEIPLELGSVISGVLTIRGDTTGRPLYENDDGTDPIEVWIDAWAPETGKWSGASVVIERGENKSADFAIAGLNDGLYELGAEIGKGYELADANGNKPVFVDLSGSVQTRLVLAPHQGVLTGSISGDGVTLDFSRVVVQVIQPWDWIPPKTATVADGGVDPATGTYTISGLGAGDYVVRAGMAANPSNYDGSGVLMSEPGAGVVTERVFVENDAAVPAVLNIVIPKGYAVSGSIRLDDSNPPWHDFGDGSGGSANGIKDETGDLYDERITISGDLAGQVVMAVPVDMVFMSGDEAAHPLVGHITDNGDGSGSYRIDGLAPGAYRLVPPFTSLRISKMIEPELSDLSVFDQTYRHWVAASKVIVVSDRDMPNRDFILENGYKVTGRLTLPEVQKMANDQTDAFDWLGFLALYTTEYEFLGNALTLFKRDFDNTSRYEFEFDHVAGGDYLLQFWTDRYVVSGARFSVKTANASVNLSVEKGVNLTGRLVNEETGEPVTSADGVKVTCQAVPWVESGYRQTDPGSWSSSYIEDGSDLKTGDASLSSRKPNNTPGKFHLTALPAGHQYIIVIQAEHGRKKKGAKNYINRVIAGVEAPEGVTGDINIGTVRLREGSVITGRLTDSDGEPIPGVDVSAVPTDAHDGVGESTGVSDDKGYYTIYGIDPNVAYYDLIAAERPWLFEDWGKKVIWGEERRYNVRPGKIDPATNCTEKADFVLTRATASLNGTIAIPDSARFMIPFASEDGASYPAAYILLRKKGVPYKDMLEGIEGMTMPAPEDLKTAKYRIDNIAPGTYKIIFMNYGLPRAEINNITFEAYEEKTLNTVWDDDFYKISGALALSGGGYPSTADISGVVCMDLRERSVIFGRLTREADGSFSSYETPGLSGNALYQLIFYSDSGIDDTPEIFPVGDPFTTGYADKTRDAIIARDPEPALIFRAYPDHDNSDIVHIGVFSTTYLTDNEIDATQTEPNESTTAGGIYLKNGGGTLENITFGANRRRILADYRKSPGDERVDVTVCVHYGEKAAAKLETLSFNADTAALNSHRVSPYISDQATLGGGDPTRIYIPSGAIETTGGANLTVSIEKTKADLSLERRAGSSTTNIPAGITPASDIYEVSAKETGSGKTPVYKGLMTLQIEYDPAKVKDISRLNVFRRHNGVWTKETAGRSVDAKNTVISVEVDGLSTFIAGVGELESSGYGVAEVGEGDSSECFIISVTGTPPGKTLGTPRILFLIFIFGMAIGRSNKGNVEC